MALSKWPVLGIDSEMHPIDSCFQQWPQIAPYSEDCGTFSR